MRSLTSCRMVATTGQTSAHDLELGERQLPAPTKSENVGRCRSFNMLIDGGSHTNHIALAWIADSFNGESDDE